MVLNLGSPHISLNLSGPLLPDTLLLVSDSSGSFYIRVVLDGDSAQFLRDREMRAFEVEFCYGEHWVEAHRAADVTETSVHEILELRERSLSSCGRNKRWAYEDG